MLRASNATALILTSRTTSATGSFREAKFFVAEKIEQTRNLHAPDASRRRLRSMHYITFETAKV